MIRIDRLDHLILTVADIAATCAFCAGVLRMEVETFGDGRTALRFGDQKINLDQVDRTFEPKAARPTPGAADLCFIAATPLEAVVAHLPARGVGIEEGPVDRTGATGPLRSVYVRDPDANLIGISRPKDA
jgi:catechol 2,3-dioxygenase-like lactoylglutathione lyase family enzyme